MVKLKGLNPLPRDLILGYLTWFSLPSWAMKIVVPFPGGDQIVILHAFVGLRKIRYQSNSGGPALEVIPRVSKRMAFVHIDDVVPGES